MIPLSPGELRQIQKIRDLGLQLERNWEQKDSGFEASTLAALRQLLDETTLSGHPEVARLAKISIHLSSPRLSLKEFIHWMVPLDRLLGRSLRDDEFLMTRKDREKPLAPREPLILILDHLRSAFNVGSILRLADSVGAEEVFLCGYTPAADSAAVTKTSLGAQVKTRSFSNLISAIEEAHRLEFSVYALETAERAQSIYDEKLPSKLAWVVGNERFGLEPDQLRLCDGVRFLPQSGVKNSMNVAVALGIAAYEWKRQWLKTETK